jgi:hypothetical protein
VTRKSLIGQQLQALVDDHTFEWNSSRTKYFLNLYDINKEYETDIRSIFRRFGGVNNIVGIKIKRKKTDDV